MKTVALRTDQNSAPTFELQVHNLLFYFCMGSVAHWKSCSLWRFSRRNPLDHFDLCALIGTTETPLNTAILYRHYIGLFHYYCSSMLFALGLYSLSSIVVMCKFNDDK